MVEIKTRNTMTHCLHMHIVIAIVCGVWRLEINGQQVHQQHQRTAIRPPAVIVSVFSEFLAIPESAPIMILIESY